MILLIQPNFVEAVQVITHKSVTLDSLTSSQLRRIYSMRQSHWADNSQIIVFVLPSQHQLHKKFTQEKLKTFPYKLDRIWNKLTFSGLGTAPRVVDSQEALIKAVRNTPGSLGYAENLPKDEHVNVVKISS